MSKIRILAALLLLTGLVRGGEGRLTLLSGATHRGVVLESISDTEVRYRDERNREQTTAIEDLVSWGRAADPRLPGEPDDSDVAVLLRGGDVLHGTLVEGPEDELVIDAPHLGRLSFAVDAVSEIRFLAAWNATVDKPAYEKDERELDVFVYRNLDKLTGTFLQAGRSEVFVHGRIGERHPIAHANLLAVRFADFPAPPAREGRTLVVLLEDGSRVTAAGLRTVGDRLVVETVRQEEVRFPLDELVALHQTGGRFVFLSDRKADEETIVPWIGDSYSWDRPRYDRSFLDTPLRSGGETYRKGVGVLSGTSLTYELGEGFRLFTARIALDDAAGAEGDVAFEVILDGKTVFASKPLKVLERGDSPVRIPPIDVRGAERITLRVTYVDDFVRDYANWIEPMLIR
jgi:hypothetical protein